MVDQQITEYVMNGNTCFMNVLYEQYAPFIALQGRSDRWMDLLCCIEKYKSYSNYEPEYEKQKGVLATKEYSELQGELANAMQYKDEISVFARNNRVLTIAGGRACRNWIDFNDSSLCSSKNSSWKSGNCSDYIGTRCHVFYYHKNKIGIFTNLQIYSIGVWISGISKYNILCNYAYPKL